MSESPVLGLPVDGETQLRLLEPRYAEDYFALIERNRTYLRQWMPWAADEDSLQETRAYMRLVLGRFADNGELPAGIWYQHVLVGSIGLHHLDWANWKGEIGYWIDAGMQGRGLVTKSCLALLSYAFVHYGLNKVEIRCAPGNVRSRAIPERLGFTQEGILRQAERFTDRYEDHIVYGMLSGEWGLRKQTR